MPGPGPTDTEMFGRVPGEKEGEALKMSFALTIPAKAREPLEVAKLPYT